MNDYIDIKIKLQKNLTNMIKKNIRFSLIFIIICIGILALNIALLNNFGTGIISGTIIWCIFIIVENYTEFRHEKRLLQCYEQQEFRDTLDFFLKSLDQQKTNYENMINSLKNTGTQNAMDLSQKSPS